jgi:hypothetical protein
MATATSPLPTPAAIAKPEEVRLYSHSPIFYWWPVWLVGFFMAFLTYLDGGRLAVVPRGTEARRDWRVEVEPGRVEAREGLILPRAEHGRQPHLPPPPGEKDRGLAEPEQPYKRISHYPYLGTWFFVTLLVVFTSSNVQMRGLWEWIGVLLIALGVSLIALYGWWPVIVDWFHLLHIQINLAGYLFLATWMFAIWAVTVFCFDRRTYVIVSAGQMRVCQEIGQGEKIFDGTNLTLHLQPNILFRHRILGLFGAGDLIIRTGGPHAEVFEWPNVLFVRSRLKRIEHLLQSREMLPAEQS